MSRDLWVLLLGVGAILYAAFGPIPGQKQRISLRRKPRRCRTRDCPCRTGTVDAAVEALERAWESGPAPEPQRREGKP